MSDDKRPDGRRADELRPLEMIPGFQRHPAGSLLAKMGGTWVLCAASVEERVPPFIKGAGKGWLTAEYAMLPSATHSRKDRRAGGREKEIQRLVGRALRGAVNLDLLGERTITVDCDVLQADGGTRTASVTGGWVALAIAVHKLAQSGILTEDPERVLAEPIAAVSVGIVGGTPVLDLPYEEDSTADVDMNIVMTESGKLIEIQGTAEGAAFGRKELDRLVDLAQGGIETLCKAQRDAVSRGLS